MKCMREKILSREDVNSYLGFMLRNGVEENDRTAEGQTLKRQEQGKGNMREGEMDMREEKDKSESEGKMDK